MNTPSDQVSDEKIARLRLIIGLPVVIFALLTMFWVAEVNWLHWFSPPAAAPVPEITHRTPVVEAAPTPPPQPTAIAARVEVPASPTRSVSHERAAEAAVVPDQPILPIESPPPITVAPPRSSAATPTTVEAGIFGHITLTGTPPPEIIINDSLSDPNCGRILTAPLTTRFYQVDTNGGLADVVVSIRDFHFSGQFPVPRDSLLLDQSHCEYQPYVFGIQKGRP